MSEMAGLNDPWGIPEGQTFAEAFNKNLDAMKVDSDGNIIADDEADNTSNNDQNTQSGPSAYETFLMQQAADQQRLERMNATETLRGILEGYGLMSLYNRVVGFVQDGYDPESIMVLIRTTPEYKQRFPAMEELAKKGRAISESAYIEYEQTAAQLERRYGLPAGMITGNVTSLLTKDVSATELNDRVVLASAAAIQAPQELRNTFRDYYGIDEGGLTAYFLDPEVAAPLLERQAASALIGSEGRMQGVGVDRATAERLQSLGVSQDQARTGFADVAGAAGLSSGRGETVSQGELIEGSVAGSAAAVQKRQRVAASRAGAFQGGSGFSASQQGVSGLGSSSV